MNINQRVERMERYKKAYVELDAIIDSFDDETQSKIPRTFRNFIKSKKDPNYHFELEEDKSLLEQNLMQETYNMISLMYRSYFCTKEEREFLADKDREELKRIEQEKRDKYDTDRICQERLQQRAVEQEQLKEIQRQQEEQSLMAYKQLPWYMKLFHKIRNLFKRK